MVMATDAITPIAVAPTDTVVYGVDVTMILAPLLFGILGSTFFTGIVLLLLGRFWTSASKGNESMIDRILVSVVSFALPIAWCFQLRLVSWTLVAEFGQPAALGNEVDFSYGLYLTFCALNIASCQAFFALRAYRINDRNIVFGICLGLTIPAVLGLAWYIGIMSTVHAQQGYGTVQLAQLVGKKISAYCYLSAAFDIVVASSIVVKLWGQRSGVNRQADSVIFRICELSLATSLLTALCALSIAICYAVGSAQTLYWSEIPQHVMGQAFAISMLWTIVNKQSLRDRFSTSRLRPSNLASKLGGSFPSLSPSANRPTTSSPSAGGSQRSQGDRVDSLFSQPEVHALDFLTKPSDFPEDTKSCDRV